MEKSFRKRGIVITTSQQPESNNNNGNHNNYQYYSGEKQTQIQPQPQPQPGGGKTCSFTVYMSNDYLLDSFASLRLILKLKNHVNDIDNDELNKYGILSKCNYHLEQDQLRDYNVSLRDIPFSLDILWIHNSGEIKQIDHNCSAGSDQMITFSKPKQSGIRFIFETFGGICEKYNIKQGDSIKFMSMSYKNILPCLCNKDLEKLNVIKATLNEFFFCDGINAIIAEYAIGDIVTCNNPICENVIWFYHTYNIDDNDKYFISENYETDGIIYCEECIDTLVTCIGCEKLCTADYFEVKGYCSKTYVCENCVCQRCYEEEVDPVSRSCYNPDCDIIEHKHVCCFCKNHETEFKRVISNCFINTRKAKGKKQCDKSEYRLEKNQFSSNLKKKKWRHRHHYGEYVNYYDYGRETRWHKKAVSNWKYLSNTQQILRYCT